MLHPTYTLRLWLKGPALKRKYILINKYFVSILCVKQCSKYQEYSTKISALLTLELDEGNKQNVNI